jgi:hypothetical protein
MMQTTIETVIETYKEVDIAEAIDYQDEYGYQEE